MAENGNGTKVSASLPLIISTAVVVLTVVGGFWSLADPRAELRDIRSGYLTLREHQEFLERVKGDISRLEAENVRQNERLNKGLVDGQGAKDSDLDRRLNQMAEELRELRRNTVEQKQLDGRMALMQRQFDTLERYMLSGVGAKVDSDDKK